MRRRDRRRPEPAAAPPGRSRRHVIFALAGVAYAVDAALVRRSLPVPEPLAPEVAFLGQSFPLVDLRTLFRLPPSADPGRLVLLVQTAGGRAGLIVDDLVQLVGLAESEIGPLPRPFRGVERSWFTGLARLGSRVVVVLSPEAVVAAGTVLPPVLPAATAAAR
jgi:chemotaxis protein histidine kinase CheA